MYISDIATEIIIIVNLKAVDKLLKILRAIKNEFNIGHYAKKYVQQGQAI